MRDCRLYLDDILESCGKIRHYTDGMLFDEFVSDLKTQDAVIRNFE
ncbi:MAG: HepT-like ribonuclease domain-containing protein, partial [Desulfomonilaceae bacterium]